MKTKKTVNKGNGFPISAVNAMSTPMGNTAVTGNVKNSIGKMISKVIIIILQIWVLFAVWFLLVFAVLAVACNLIMHFEDNTVAVNIWGSIQNAFQGELEETLVLFGEKIFANIPFVDVLNALFITKHKVSGLILLNDIAITALSGLIFFIVSRINYTIKTLVSKKGIYAVVTSLWIVLSVCIALIIFAFLESKFDAQKFFVIKILLIIVPTLLHVLFLSVGLRDIKFVRILLYVVRSLLESVTNNMMLWVCSILTFTILKRSNISLMTSIVSTIYGGFFILAIYELIRQGFEEWMLRLRYKI